MAKFNNIFLVGPMGAGKTTIGKTLSEITEREFIDSDLYIEEKSGADIAWIFDVEGEEGFRKREEIAISELSKKTNVILATGGGAVKNINNRKNLKAGGIVIYLLTSVEKQFSRTGRDKRRPLLNNDDPLGTLTKLMQERDPLYREVADIIIDTDQLNAHQVAIKIIDLIKKFKG
jgi:shikimate kinase